jgi:hypothetical protein
MTKQSFITGPTPRRPQERNRCKRTLRKDRLLNRNVLRLPAMVANGTQTLLRDGRATDLRCYPPVDNTRKGYIQVYPSSTVYHKTN